VGIPKVMQKKSKRETEKESKDGISLLPVTTPAT
jgi:hypothetical protein